MNSYKKHNFQFFLTEEGIEMFSNDEQIPKTDSPIKSIDDGILICFNDEHSVNAESPIDLTDDGIVICSREEQKLKAFDPIIWTDDGIVISLSKQPKNAYDWIETREEGISNDTFDNDKQPSNECSPIKQRRWMLLKMNLFHKSKVL